jgi:hypothetical protein
MRNNNTLKKWFAKLLKNLFAEEKRKEANWNEFQSFFILHLYGCLLKEFKRPQL